MSKRLSFVFALSLFGVVTAHPSLAQNPPQLTAAECGNPNARTAIGQLPTVRVVVFDPLSNSFAFVAPCEVTTGTLDVNRDRMDARRLALTTQALQPGGRYPGSAGREQQRSRARYVG